MIEILWLLQTRKNHPNLVEPEISSLVKSYTKYGDGGLFTVNLNQDEIDAFIKRVASVKSIIADPIFFPSENLLRREKIIDLLKSIPMDLHKTNFRVRLYHIAERNKEIKSDIIEGMIGKELLTIYPNLKVNLSNPSSELIIFVYHDVATIGWLYKKIPFSEFDTRSPRFNPYFGGGAMKPLLSHICVNLLGNLDAVILDPFAGHGGMLREVASMNCFAIGFEINYRVVHQAKMNNKHHQMDSHITLFLADALHPPLRKNAITQVVTDPPYAMQTTTIGRDRDQLIIDWLNIQSASIKIIITTPTEMLYVLPDGWYSNLDVKDYVHKSLTRRIRRIYK